MREIQKSLEKYDIFRVEIYSSHLILYDFEDGVEIETFDTEKELLEYIKNQLD